MASDPGSRVEELPPALPVKQHRSRSSRNSSVESDCVIHSPVGLQHQNYTCSDVFSEPTDCHAAQCPIHHHHDPSRHQVRFFSDRTPPPVPKKRLLRTLSLPGANAPSLSPLQRQPLNFDNPLYMLASIPDSCYHEETEAIKNGPVPFLPLSQLSFDTPDKHLAYLFSSFDDQRVVFQGIQHRHLLFLRSMALSVDAGILLQGEATERDVSSYTPQDFLLCEGTGPKHIGDTVFYSLHSPKLPGRVLGLRVQQCDETSLAHIKHLQSHVNMQDVIAHFQLNTTLRDDSSVVQTQEPSLPFKPCCTAAEPPGGGSTEHTRDHMNINLPSIQSVLMKGYSVTVERDLPHATLEDFVQNSSRLQSTDCSEYDRQVCVLLLQILLGSQHLYNTSASAAELRPQEIFLVWPNRERREGKQGREDSDVKTNRLKDEMEIQMLWKAHGSPRVVLTPLSSAPPVPHPLIYIQSKILAIIKLCLHSQEFLTSLGSSPTLSKSSYRRGLLYLASLLQSESSRTHMADMVAKLQVLLWGPRVALSDHRCPLTTTVHNWLTIKRALLVMKLAERGLIQDQSVPDWEDCMCLKYLSFTDPEAVVSAASQLWLTLHED